MPSTVLVLGATSRVGSHFVAHPPAGWSVVTAGRTDPRSRGLTVDSHTPLDLSDEAAVRGFLRGAKADACVNFAARTDVDGCEKERSDPSAARPTGLPGSAWTLNAELPRWVAEEEERAGRFFVHISTDYVFDGTHGPYPEATPPSPPSEKVSWYGVTKGIGESAVFSSKGPRSVLRISHPYGNPSPGGIDLALTLLAQRREDRLHPLYVDQRITPTWIPDVSTALGAILDLSSTRIYHVASPEVTSPYGFAKALFASRGWRTDDLRTASLASQARDPARAARPVLGGLLVREVHKLDVRPRSFREGIRELLDVEGVPFSPAAVRAR